MLKDKQSATRDFKKAIEQDPKKDRAYFNLGSIYLENKNYPLALENFQKNRELNPDSADANFKLGETYHEMNSTTNAQQFYQKAIEPAYIQKCSLMP